MNAGTIRAAGLALLLAGLLGACSTSVERIDSAEVRDLSGAWNDTDSRLVSEEMIADVLTRPWIDNHERNARKPPVVIVGEVRNLSHEHINTVTFVADLERALINSGRVEMVASSKERGEIRGERKDQDLNAREDTRKEMGQEIGADYMLKGTINTIIDVDGKDQIRFYQVDLNMISLADNRKVWQGQKKIKKDVKRAKIRF
ncbi:MAG TPA: penicillin-binding protein activator LpoB [Rhodocyclaceae bacterium]